MLQDRLWSGGLLILLVGGVLAFDQHLTPWCPFLALLLLGLSLAGGAELVRLIDEDRRPAEWICLSGIAVVLLVNWFPHVFSVRPPGPVWEPWQGIAATFAAVVMAAFLREMAVFHEPGNAVNRIALTVLTVAYLGLLPSFLAQLRWPAGAGTTGDVGRATLTLAMAIFVPKCCDIGAYFGGRFLGGRVFGHHPMTPVLSPKKTWEGAVGGLTGAAVAAVTLDAGGPVLRGGWPVALLVGVILGVAGMLGDLAESLIKRDCRAKDASHAVPGFGGVLDVIDSVLFAAPLAYCLLRPEWV